MRVAPLLLHVVQLWCTLKIHCEGALLSCIPNTCPAQEGLHISVKSCPKPPEQQLGAKRLPCCDRATGLFAEGSPKALELNLDLVALKQEPFSNRLRGPR